MSDKKSQREKSIELRAQAHNRDDGMAARKITAQVIMLPELDEVRNISGYSPIHSEVDCLVILKALHAAQFPICLPSIAASDQPLVFREWDMRSDLSEGPFKTKQSTGAVMSPAVLLVPLVAFDEKGGRLGYGGGYYDRTLEKLRAENSDLVAIGIAYDDQKLASLPTESYDQPLDMVITEKTTYRFK